MDTLSPNNALHRTSLALRARPFLASLGAGERGRWGALTMRLTLWVLLLLQPVTATALEGLDCADRLNRGLGGPAWGLAVPHRNAMYYATMYGTPVPNTARGDFDGDKERDIAFLIEKKGRGRLIAVCLSSKPMTVLYIEPGCSDSISLDRMGTSKNDSITADCAEVTADTWVYENGKFRVIPGEGD